MCVVWETCRCLNVSHRLVIVTKTRQSHYDLCDKVNGDQFSGWVGTRWAPLSHRLSCHGINDTLKLILKIKTEKQSLLELFGTVSISLNKVYQDPKELSKYQADEATSSSKMQKMLFSETFQVLYLQSSMNIFTQETGSCLNCDTHRGNTSAHTTQSHWGPLLVI